MWCGWVETFGQSGYITSLTIFTQYECSWWLRTRADCMWFHLSHRSHWTESSLSLTSSLQTPQGYCSVIEGRQVDIQAVFKCNRKKYKSKTKKRKETNSAQHKAKYLSLFKLGHEKSPSPAYLVYLLMYVSSIFVLWAKNFPQFVHM